MEDFLNDYNSFFKVVKTLTKVIFIRGGGEKIISIKELFLGCNNLKSVEFGNALFNIEDMSSLFYDCWEITDIKFNSEFDFKKITTMKSSFYQCLKLTSLDLSPIETENLKTMEKAFNACKGL